MKIQLNVSMVRVIVLRDIDHSLYRFLFAQDACFVIRSKRVSKQI